MRSKLLVILIASASLFGLTGCSQDGNSTKVAVEIVSEKQGNTKVSTTESENAEIIESASASGQGTQKFKEETTGKTKESKYEQKEPDFLSNLTINRNGISVPAPWKLGDLEPLGIDIDPPGKNWSDKETYLPDRGINNYDLYVDGITRAEDAPQNGAMAAFDMMIVHSYNLSDEECGMRDLTIQGIHLYPGSESISLGEYLHVGASLDDIQMKYGDCGTDNFYVLKYVDSANYGGRNKDVNIYLKIDEKDGIVTHIYLDIRGQIY